MINVFLLFYLLIIVVFAGGVFVVVYHLVFYRLNRATTNILVGIFLIGSAFFFLLSLLAALAVDWDKWKLII